MQPRVTLLIPVYNHKPFLKDLIQSLYDQDYKNVHIVFSDDHSTDGGNHIIEQYLTALDSKFPRVSYVRHGENLGLRGRNNMKHLSTWIEKDSDYVAVLDGDDYLTPTSISTRVRTLQQNPQAGCVHGNFIIHLNNEITPNGWQRLGVEDIPSGFIYDHLIVNNRVIMSTAMFPTEKYKQAFDYQLFTDMKIFLGDFAAILRLARDNEIIYLKEEMLAHYRLHEKGESNNPATRQMVIEDTMRIQHLFKTGQI